MKPKQKQYPAVDVTGNRNKVRSRKEQYCIGTWNVRSMNQGKLEVVKQEMERVNVNILGISELKWTRQFRYDQNKIPDYYTVEVRNRYNGLDMIDTVPDELRSEVHDIVQETGIKTIPMEKKCK